MRNDQQTSVSDIITAIYESALRPELYREFSKAWDKGVIAPLLRGSRNDLLAASDLEHHFGLAMRIFETAKLARRQSIQTFLDEQNFAAAITKSDGVVIACNVQFQDRFKLQNGQSIYDKAEKLISTSGGNGGEPPSSIWPGSENAAIAARYHFPDGGQDVIILEKLEGHQFSRLTDGAVFLVKSCQAEWTLAGANILGKSFGLTAAEVEIAKALYEGLHTTDIALQRRRATGTVRKQIKSLLAKTEVGHQSEIIGLITGLMHVVAATPQPASEMQKVKQEGDCFQSAIIMRLPKMRQLQYARYGHMEGTPVLFLHGHTSSAEPTQLLVECAANEKLQIIAPCKPGVQQSSPANESFKPLAFIEDCLRMLDSLGIERIPIAGHAMSGVYAINAAAEYPDRFSSVALLDTGIPLTKEEQFLRMPEGSRRIFHTAWNAPDLLYAPFAFAADTFGQSEEHEEIVMKTQFAESKRDSQLLLSPAYYRLAKQAMSDFFSTPRRSVDELIYWVSDWTESLDKVSKNSTVLFVHSEEHEWLPYQDVFSFCSKRPNVSSVILENTAQLFVYEKTEVFCKSLRLLN